jgi:hypothetical protein
MPLTKKDENMLRIFERKILRCTDQLRKTVCGDQGIIMNYINYIMNQI